MKNKKKFEKYFFKAIEQIGKSFKILITFLFLCGVFTLIITQFIRGVVFPYINLGGQSALHTMAPSILEIIIFMITVVISILIPILLDDKEWIRGSNTFLFLFTLFSFMALSQETISAALVNKPSDEIVILAFVFSIGLAFLFKKALRVLKRYLRS